MSISPQLANPIEVFCSYAEKDEVLREQLEKHLSLMKLQGLITLWYDRKVTAGTEKLSVIEEHLNNARIILLLISPDFMASDYLNSVELTRAMERHTAQEVRVIPILLRPVEWELANFGVLEILPQNKKPIISWTSCDEAFLEVAKGIRKAIETLPPFSLPNPGQKTKEQWREVGDSFSQAAQYRDALLAYEQLPRLDPNDAQAYVSKGDALRHLNRYEEALVAYQQALRLAPGNAAASEGKGYTLYRLNRYEEAISTLENTLSLQQHASACNSRGEVLVALNRREEALTAFEQAVQLDPHFVLAYNNKASILDRLNRHEEAIATWKQAVAAFEQAIKGERELTSAKLASAYEGKGHALAGLKRYEDALTTFEHAIRLDPYNVRAYEGKGAAFYYLQSYEAALVAFEQAIATDVYDAIAYSNKGHALLFLNRYAEALAAFE